MSTPQEQKNKTKLDLYAINEILSEKSKKYDSIFENNVGALDDSQNKIFEDLKDKMKLSPKKLDDFKKKINKKSPNKNKDIFSELLEVCYIFLSNNKNSK